MKINQSLDENIKFLDKEFLDCGDIVKRKFPVGEYKKHKVYVLYIDMLVDRKLVESTLMDSLMLNIRQTSPSAENIRGDVFELLKNGGIPTVDLSETEKFDDVTLAVLSGDTVVLIDDYPKAIIVSTKGWPNRGIPTAETEVVVQGSKEAFSEVFRFNTVLIRRRIRDVHLKVKQMKVGRRSATDVALMYLDDVVRPQVLQEALERVQNIDIDAILDCGYIEQFKEDDWISPFPQVQVTERPDKAAAAILEGRIVIVVDNSPFVLIIPATFNTFFQASEDYYQRWQIMSFVRVIRYIAGVMALILPASYIAAAVFHPSMLPTLLTFKMAGARQTVPFPAVVEIIIMEFAFELLREAGIRLPGPVGNTMGVVGGIIIGQAAVEAGLVSPIVVIIVSLTAISSFAIPHVQFISGYRVLKYMLIMFSAVLGLFGLWLGLLIVLIHLASLKTFGFPYMFPFSSGGLNDYKDFKDSIFRMPLFLMKSRPIFANPNETTRLKPPRIGNKRKKE